MSAHRATLAGMVLSLLGCGPVHRYPDGTGLEGQFEREVVALKLKIRELEARLERAPLANTSNDRVPELLQVFSGSGVRVQPSRQGAMLLVPIELVFADVRSLRLRDEGDMVFELLAIALQKHEQGNILVVGHWSDRPSPRPESPNPMQLTLDLARVFAERLESLDLPAERIIVAGRGRTAPLTSNDLLTGQEANQRIEVIFATAVPETD